MNQEEEARILEIIGQMTCPKGFVCHESGFQDLCKAQDVGMFASVLCLEKRPKECRFSLMLERSAICECPLRVYIAKRLKM